MNDNNDDEFSSYPTKMEKIKLLCLLSSVKFNKFYIPGETKLADTLKKMALDYGLFTALTLIH